MTAPLPYGCRLHAPSWHPRHAAELAREVAVHHLPVDLVSWPGGGPLWARERFIRSRRGAGLIAYSVDDHNRVIRGWFSTPADHVAYSAGGAGTFGPVTCPIEAAWLASLQPGQPSLPAHLWIGAARGWPDYEAALDRVLGPAGSDGYQLGSSSRLITTASASRQAIKPGTR